MKYTIKAKPTRYKGRQYRSRLEAKWAAYFDRSNFDYEYEPFDLGVWSPDFLLKGSFGGDILVEVKPISKFDRAVARKMMSANFSNYDEQPFLMLCGVDYKSKWIYDQRDPRKWEDAKFICGFDEVKTDAYYFKDIPNYGAYGVMHEAGPPNIENFYYAEHYQWDEACNAAQWEII